LALRHKEHFAALRWEIFVLVFVSRDYPTFHNRADLPILRCTTIGRYALYIRTESARLLRMVLAAGIAIPESHSKNIFKIKYLF
jgi:hypothetical protein